MTHFQLTRSLIINLDQVETIGIEDARMTETGETTKLLKITLASGSTRTLTGKDATAKWDELAQLIRGRERRRNGGPNP